MPKPPSKKSQLTRKPKCRKCYTPMVEQGHLDGGWDWLCLKCGLRWRSDGVDLFIGPAEEAQGNLPELPHN